MPRRSPMPDTFGDSQKPGQNQKPQDGQISADKAQSIALEHAEVRAKDATFVRSNLDWDDGRWVYEVEFYTADGMEYDYEIDAVSGAVVQYDHDAEYYKPQQSDNGTLITESRPARSRWTASLAPAKTTCGSSWTMTMAARSTRVKFSTTVWNTSSRSTAIPHSAGVERRVHLRLMIEKSHGKVSSRGFFLFISSAAPVRLPVWKGFGAGR